MDNLIICLSGALQELSDLLPPPLSMVLLACGIWIWRLLRENARLRVREAQLVAQLTQSTVVISMMADKIPQWRSLLKPGVRP